MSATIEDIQQMLAADGYAMAIERRDPGARVVVTAGDGVCDDCLVPKNVMAGILAPVLGVERDSIELIYPVEATH
jgi:hypothetical protein